MVVVNRADLDRALADRIERACAEREVEVLGRVPYDPSVIKALVEGKTAVDPDHHRLETGSPGDGGAARAIRDIWSRLHTSGRLAGPGSREMTL